MKSTVYIKFFTSIVLDRKFLTGGIIEDSSILFGCRHDLLTILGGIGRLLSGGASLRLQLTILIFSVTWMSFSSVSDKLNPREGVPETQSSLSTGLLLIPTVLCLTGPKHRLSFVCGFFFGRAIVEP
jgi:hypothetical protein